MTNKKYLHEDIADSPEDEEKLKPDQAILNLPEVRDIPGATRSGKNAGGLPGDATISSADEEGDELFRDDPLFEDADVSPLEKKMLNESFDPSYETDPPVGSFSLDEKDNEGETLEEAGQSKDLFGIDLDDELIKEQDEESTGEGQQ